MYEKPDCSCWKDPQKAADRELRIDGMGTAIQVSIDQSCRMMRICPVAAPYVGGSVMAAVLFWVAFELRGDGESPTPEQVASAGEQVIKLAKERLAGARFHDLDQMPTKSNLRN